MKLIFKNIWVLLLMIVFISSCDTIHVYPEGEPIDPSNVKLEINTSIFYSDSSITKPIYPTNSTITNYNVTVEVYSDGRNDLVFQNKYVVSSDELHNNQFSLSLTLDTKKYNIAMWASPIDDHNPAAKFYTNDEGLKRISLLVPMLTPTEHKDCFYATNSIDLTPYTGQLNVNKKVSVTFMRPSAKYYLIANDLEAYIKKESTKGQNLTKADIENFTVKLSYIGFTPSGLDAFTGKLNNAKTGLSFSSGISILNDNEAIIAMDYPFAYPEKSTIKVSLDIYNQNGVLANQNGNIQIDIKRDSLTILRSDFFTRFVAPGVTINPEYDGVIDVILPD